MAECKPFADAIARNLIALSSQQLFVGRATDDEGMAREHPLQLLDRCMSGTRGAIMFVDDHKRIQRVIEEATKLGLTLLYLHTIWIGHVYAEQLDNNWDEFKSEYYLMVPWAHPKHEQWTVKYRRGWNYDVAADKWIEPDETTVSDPTSFERNHRKQEMIHRVNDHILRIEAVNYVGPVTPMLDPAVAVSSIIGYQFLISVSGLSINAAFPVSDKANQALLDAEAARNELVAKMV